MAILNSIRKRGVFLIVIIALALFSFVLADVIRNGGFGTDKAQTTIATVNGVDIPRTEFMEEVENYQRALGPSGSQTQAMNVIWERELRSTLLKEQYESLGMVAEQEWLDESLSLSLANNPTFTNEAGLYDESLVADYLANIRGNVEAENQWATFMRNTRRNILEQAYLNMIRSGMVATLADGQQEYRYENDKINIEFVQVPYESIADEDVPVSDSEIDKYIRDNAEEYEVESQVDIQYVVFNNDPSEEDKELVRTQLGELLIGDVDEDNNPIPGFAADTNHVAFLNRRSDFPFNDNWLFKDRMPESIADTIFALNVGEVYGPYELGDYYNVAKVVDSREMADSAKAKHILIRFDAENATPNFNRTQEEAGQLADSILTAVRSNRSKFSDLAAEFSDDANNKDNGGDLGYFTPGTMVDSFNDFIFDGSEGKLGVVETQFGFHIVEVEELKNVQRVIQVATLAKEIEPSEPTLNEVFSKAVGVELDVAKRDFREVALENELDVKPVNEIKELDSNIPGVGDNRQLVSWAFNEETNVGDTKRFEVPTGYLIAQLTRRTPKGLMSISEASATVTPILRNEKKAALIRQGISGTTLQEVAASQGVTVKNATAITMAAPTIAGAGTEPEVVGAAFGKAAGETTDLIDGNLGVYMVRVLTVSNAADLDTYEAYAEQVKNKVLPLVNNTVYNALKSAADIEDNRSEIF